MTNLPNQNLQFSGISNFHIHLKGHGGREGKSWESEEADLTMNSPLEVGPQMGSYDKLWVGSGMPLILSIRNLGRIGESLDKSHEGPMEMKWANFISGSIVEMSQLRTVQRFSWPIQLSSQKRIFCPFSTFHVILFLKSSHWAKIFFQITAALGLGFIEKYSCSKDIFGG